MDNNLLLLVLLFSSMVHGYHRVSEYSSNTYDIYNESDGRMERHIRRIRSIQENYTSIERTYSLKDDYPEEQDQFLDEEQGQNQFRDEERYKREINDNVDFNETTTDSTTERMVFEQELVLPGLNISTSIEIGNITENEDADSNKSDSGSDEDEDDGDGEKEDISASFSLMPVPYDDEEIDWPLVTNRVNKSDLSIVPKIIKLNSRVVVQPSLYSDSLKIDDANTTDVITAKEESEFNDTRQRLIGEHPRRTSKDDFVRSLHRRDLLNQDEFKDEAEIDGHEGKISPFSILHLLVQDQFGEESTTPSFELHHSNCSHDKEVGVEETTPKPKSINLLIVGTQINPSSEDIQQKESYPAIKIGEIPPNSKRGMPEPVPIITLLDHSFAKINLADLNLTSPLNENVDMMKRDTDNSTSAEALQLSDVDDAAPSGNGDVEEKTRKRHNTDEFLKFRRHAICSKCTTMTAAMFPVSAANKPRVARGVDYSFFHHLYHTQRGSRKGNTTPANSVNEENQGPQPGNNVALSTTTSAPITTSKPPKYTPGNLRSRLNPKQRQRQVESPRSYQTTGRRDPETVRTGVNVEETPKNPEKRIYGRVHSF